MDDTKVWIIGKLMQDMTVRQIAVKSGYSLGWCEIQISKIKKHYKVNTLHGLMHEYLKEQYSTTDIK